MPFFRKKFSPKKTPCRKVRTSHEEERESLVLDNRTVLLQLGRNNLRFQNGEWIPESGEDASLFKTNQKLRKRVQELLEEKNIFKVKFEILLNMLTQATAESHLQQREIEKLRKASDNR